MEAQKELGVLIYNSFEALNLYGKKPESLEAVASLFQRILGNHCITDIDQAFNTWMQRESKFPTPSDICGLIERGGRPPLSEAMYVSINKKDACERTAADWKYMQDFESHQRTGNSDNTLAKALKDNDFLRRANSDLCNQLDKLEAQNDIVCQRIAELENKKYQTKATLVSKINATIKFMRETGACEEDIQAFINRETKLLLAINVS